MAEKTYLKSINLGGVVYGLGITSDDIYAELGISKERFVELLSRDFYCPALDSAPTSSTLTYVDTDGSVNHFQTGQPCRWKDTDGNWQLSILKDVSENTALWYQLPVRLSQLEDDLGLATEEGVNEKISSLSVGAVNLLRNSGFTGDYTYELLESPDSLAGTTEVYSNPLKYWEGSAVISDDSKSASGKSARITELSQQISLEAGVDYVASFKAKGSEITISCGTASETFTLSSGYRRYSMKFQFSGTGNFQMSGSAHVCDLKLERGTFATDWTPSVLDNDKTLSEFKNIKYLTDGIKETSAEELKGMTLTTSLKVGNYKDGSLQQVNGGVSGIYNGAEDVAFWGGGTMEQAIQTVTAFKENPDYLPTPEEWTNLCKFIVTHGGDAYFRGYIYAIGGEMTVSKVNSKNFYANGNQGLSQVLDIQSPDGVHQLQFEGGLLVSSTFTANN